MEGTYPQENQSGEVGHHAVQCFHGRHPPTWRPKDLAGDSDYGYDFLVDVIVNGKARWPFFVQVKGSSRVKDDGTSELLNAEQTFYSLTIDLKNVNYYLQLGYPVMLVLADLSKHADPRECLCYYLWMNDPLRELSGGRITLDHLGQDSFTFRIPRENLLRDVDVAPRLSELSEYLRAAEQVHAAVTDVSKEKDVTVEAITRGIVSRVIPIDPGDLEQELPWNTYPDSEHSMALLTVHRLLKSHAYDEADARLAELEDAIEQANDHERSEYFRQKSVTASFRHDNDTSWKFACRAHTTSPNLLRYKSRYYSKQLERCYNDADAVEHLLDEIKDDASDEVKEVCVRALATLGRFTEARALLVDLDASMAVRLDATVHYLSHQHEDVVAIAEKALGDGSCSKLDENILRILLARSLFEIGAGPRWLSGEIKEFPFGGIPGMNLAVLGQAWQHIQAIWQNEVTQGFTEAVEHIFDITVILATLFGEQEHLLMDLVRYSQKRPEQLVVRYQLIELCQQSGRDELIAELLRDLPVSGEKVLQEAALLYRKSNLGALVDLVSENLSLLSDDRPRGYLSILAMAAIAAKRTFRNRDRDCIVEAIRNEPDSETTLAVVQFLLASLTARTTAQEELGVLIRLFREGRADIQLLTQLLDHLDLSNPDQATLIPEVAARLATIAQLSDEQFDIFCQSYITVEDWKSLVEIAQARASQMSLSSRHTAFLAIGLDELGDTQDALDLLGSIDWTDDPDARSLNQFAAMAVRTGKVDTALVLFRRALEVTLERKQSLEYCRILFVLTTTKDPQSPDLVGLCEAYGELARQDNEQEEGIFILLAQQITLVNYENTPEEFIQQVRERMNAFLSRFPDSKIFSAIQHNDEDSVEELLNKVREKTGITDEQIASWQRNENLLRRQKLHFPFAGRAAIVSNVGDVLRLWNYLKLGIRDDATFRLIVAEGEYSATQEAKLSKIPLLDITALLMINELKLFPLLFQVFPRIAVDKNTMMTIQNLSFGFLSSPCHWLAKEISSTLEQYSDLLIQPGKPTERPRDFELSDLDRLGELVQDDGYLLYSDDLITRIYALGDEQGDFSTNTLEVLLLLRDKRIISEKVYRDKIVSLCGWSVSGVRLTHLDLMSCFEHLDVRHLAPEQAEEAMGASGAFDAMINYVWDIAKPYVELLREISQFMAHVLVHRSTYDYPEVFYEVLVSKLTTRLMFPKEGGENSKLGYFARLYLMICRNTPIATDQYAGCSLSQNYCWSRFQSVVERRFANDYEDPEQALIEQVAVQAARLDAKRDCGVVWIEPAASGLIAGSSEHTNIMRRYEEEMLTLTTETSQ